MVYACSGLVSTEARVSHATSSLRSVLIFTRDLTNQDTGHAKHEPIKKYIYIYFQSTQSM